ncbi:MAG: hypothetical protein ACTHLR_05860 [Rhizomicrobium sp.]
MKIPYATGLSALLLLCSMSVASAADNAPANAMQWYDSVNGTKLTSVEGSAAELSMSDDGLALDVTAPDGRATGKVFRYLTDSLGAVFDVSDKANAIGVFRQTAGGIEAEYADGHNEILSINPGGGLTIAITAPNAQAMCVKWYPQGHVFDEADRKQALAAYARKLGLASQDRAPAPLSSNCAEEPMHVAANGLAPRLKAKTPSRFALAASKSSSAPKTILVRTSDVHPIDADAMSASLVHPTLGATVVADATPAAAIGAAHLVPTSAEIPANHGASNCLSIDSDGQNWGFRNACDNSVQFAYCLENGRDPQTACGTGTASGGVAKNGFFALIASTAVIDDNHQFRWVACSGDAGTVTPHLDRSSPPAGRCVRSQNS